MKQHIQANKSVSKLEQIKKPREQLDWRGKNSGA